MDGHGHGSHDDFGNGCLRSVERDISDLRNVRSFRDISDISDQQHDVVEL